MRTGFAISLGAHGAAIIVGLFAVPYDEDRLRDVEPTISVTFETAPGAQIEEATAPEPVPDVAPDVQEIDLDSIAAPIFDPNAPPPPAIDVAPVETVQDDVEDPSERDAEADLTAVRTRVVEPDLVDEVDEQEVVEAAPPAPTLSLPGAGRDQQTETPRGQRLGAPAAPSAPRIASLPSPPPTRPSPPTPDETAETTPDEDATEEPVEAAEGAPPETENRPAAEEEAGAEEGTALTVSSRPQVRPRNFEQQLAEADAAAEAERAEAEERDRLAREEDERQRQEAEAAAIAAAVAAAADEEAPTEATTTVEATGETTAAPALGPPLTAGEIDGLRVQVGQCWRVPDGIENADDLRVVLSIDLDADGKVAGGPRLVEPAVADTPALRTAFEAARRAILRCGGAGFDLPAEKYEQWKVLELEFVPEGVLARW